jgi:EAL domain-containing protein (putative c-di-GMP-specific phosphodiesterase class I)
MARSSTRKNPSSDELELQTCAAGETVFECGDAGDCAYLIKQGSVEVITVGQGEEVSVAILKSGELFGETALLEQGPRAMTVRALDETVLLTFPRSLVNAQLEKSDPVLGHLLFALLERARHHPYPAAAPGTVGSGEVQRAASPGGATARFSLTGGMGQALELDEFVLHYQPISALETLHPIGFEALIRWQHPVRGLIQPEDFLWLVEQAGMMRQLVVWTLEQACRDWQTLRRFIPGRPFVSFSLAPAYFSDEEMISAIMDILARGVIGADELRFVLTETVLLEQPELAGRILGKLVELGGGAAAGVEGSGDSAVDRIQDSPNGILKIDKSFVTSMLDSTLNLSIVQSAIDLAHSLNLLVVAEGIENEDILRQLMLMGCDCGQSWLFGRPQPIEDYLAIELHDS